MALTYPRPSPVTFGLASVTWRASDVRARSRSPFTMQLQQQFFAGQMWTGTLGVVPQYEEDGRALAAWLTSLRRSPGTFLLGDPAAEDPLGSAADTPGTPVVDGAGQTGDLLAVSGLPSSAEGYLLAGDYVQLGVGSGSRLHMLLEDVDTDTAGDAIFTLWPSMHAAPNNGSAVVVSNPAGVFITRPNVSEWSVSRTLYEGITIEVEEVV